MYSIGIHIQTRGRVSGGGLTTGSNDGSDQNSANEDKGNYTGPKKKQDTRQGTPESPRLEKLMKVMYNMKAEMGALRRALHQAGICVDAP